MQNNTNFEFGPLEKTQDVLNIQPVLPFSLNTNWNLITRTIVPVISQPAFTPDQDRVFGIGDIQFSAFFSPKKVVGGWVWGVGAIAQLDTATNNRLGQGAWGLGPTAVALHLGKTWVYGALINNVWSVSKDEGRSSVNQMLLQPFINYNFPDSPGRYLTFAPIITADWEADSGQRWVVPLGLGHRADHAFRETASEPAGFGVLQHREAGQRRKLAAAFADPVSISKVTLMCTRITSKPHTRSSANTSR